MKTLLAGLSVLGALLIGFAPTGVGASTGYSPAGLIRHAGSAPAAPHVNALKAAGTFGCGTITCDAFQTGINSYFQDVGAASGTGNSVYSVNNQYYDNTGNIAYTETFGGTYLEQKSFPANGCSSLYASTCLTESQLVTEINSVLTTKSWTANSTNLFVILLPYGVDTCIDGQNVCSSNYFCAYHDNQSSLIFAVEPFQTEWSCGAANAGQGFPNGHEIDETVNTLSHEQNESITDPYPEDIGGWWTNDASQYEIGDLCAWGFGTPLGTTLGGQPYNQVINGHNYSLQLEYSNAANSNAGGCVPYLGGPASPATNGHGPLAYQGGTVMRTNHVYTIYWIPAPPPALSVSPVVTGTPAVGQQLSTSNGTWTNSPTSYAYKWQRCNSIGTNCFDIPNATSSNYTPVAADTGHELRSEVLASNGAGGASGGYAPSTPTGVVVAKPTVTTLPKISGTRTVGNSLSVSNGAWNGSPASYGYQWLRCSSMGTACKSIGGATSSSYMLVSADAGHTLAAKVTATNVAGSTTATSKKTGLVKK